MPFHSQTSFNNVAASPNVILPVRARQKLLLLSNSEPAAQKSPEQH
jgi:hypothetical protein